MHTNYIPDGITNATELDQDARRQSLHEAWVVAMVAQDICTEHGIEISSDALALKIAAARALVDTMMKIDALPPSEGAGLGAGLGLVKVTSTNS